MSDPATERYAAAPAPALLRRVQSFLNTRSTGRPPAADLLAGPAPANSSVRAPPPPPADSGRPASPVGAAPGPPGPARSRPDGGNPAPPGPGRHPRQAP